MADDHRAEATHIVRRLAEAGHAAYFAGGSVRDELLGLHPQDFDVATDAPPERIAELFRRTRAVGKSFGVMLVRERRVWVEVATFRVEHGYTDRRRPDAVTYCDAEQDALRRDFTINALFIDPLDETERPGGRVIDYVGGVADLETRVVRAVGDPDARLAEDHLRALRAVRFTARLGFRLDDATAGAITRHATELAGVSRERIGDEIRRMLAHAERAAAAELMQRLGLDGPALGEGDVPAAQPRALGGLTGDVEVSTALAAWAIDRAAHASPGADAARLAEAAGDAVGRWRRALCLTNDERDAMRAVLRLLGDLDERWESMAVARRRRSAASPAFAGAIAILRALRPDAAAAVLEETRRLGAGPGGIAPPPLITGDDLIDAGHAPGPMFAKWLDIVYDAQLEGRVVDRDEALALVARLAAGDSAS